jgi:hypothetical protein
VNKVSPIIRAFKNKSLAPLRYLADKITLTKKAVRTISVQNDCNSPFYKDGTKSGLELNGLAAATPGSS